MNTHYWSGPLFFDTGKTYRDHEGVIRTLSIYACFDLGKPNIYIQCLCHDDPLITWLDHSHFNRPVLGSDGNTYMLYCYLDYNRTPHFYKMTSPQKTYSENINAVCCIRKNKKPVFFTVTFSGDGEPPTYADYCKMKRLEQKTGAFDNIKKFFYRRYFDMEPVGYGDFEIGNEFVMKNGSHPKICGYTLKDMNRVAGDLRTKKIPTVIWILYDEYLVEYRKTSEYLKTLKRI
jgi:hypothetical protein